MISCITQLLVCISINFEHHENLAAVVLKQSFVSISSYKYHVI